MPLQRQPLSHLRFRLQQFVPESRAGCFTATHGQQALDDLYILPLIATSYIKPRPDETSIYYSTVLTLIISPTLAKEYEGYEPEGFFASLRVPGPLNPRILIT
jgi:hypothetical protein